jgi:hypothetical protein
LRDASVAGIVEVYDFMTGPTGRELVKKVWYSRPIHIIDI